MRVDGQIQSPWTRHSGPWPFGGAEWKGPAKREGSIRPTLARCVGSSRRGYTLIEVVVATAILAVGLTALVRGFASGLNSMRVTENRAMAVELARQKLAEITAMSDPIQGTNNGDVAEPWQRFRWETEVEPTEEFPSLMYARVTMYWSEGLRAEDATIETVYRAPASTETSGTTGAGSGAAGGGGMGR